MFVGELKKADVGVLFNSRLVAQNYRYTDASEIATKAPTIQRFSQRLILSLVASIDGMRLFIRDITQAYEQSTTDLETEVFIRPPNTMPTRAPATRMIVKSLYWIPESGLHWYLTKLQHHLGDLCIQ